ncbi:hypothetical protein HPB48_006525 [Haemaphysalis longicornis]|uniref:Uncharacterized protein n=1 Tax=Haemaphysalis longicornis TaxID=44386 RepID=A0A9J6H3I7_HAELO|nr:hypothetical protein HPB48_006525 [Haemaphysalis longicornis]
MKIPLAVHLKVDSHCRKERSSKSSPTSSTVTRTHSRSLKSFIPKDSCRRMQRDGIRMLTCPSQADPEAALVSGALVCLC